MTRPRAGIVRQLPATREAVDRFCQELDRGLLASLPAAEKFAIQLLVREALTNAVIHGAKTHSDARVECEVGRIAGGVTIRVADPGAGFDWRRWLRERPQPLAESGRGLHILHLYASEVRFLGTGNEVELTRMFSAGDGYGI